MAEYEKAVRDILKDNGCFFVRRGKDDHDIWYSHTANEIMKQSGIKKRF